MAFAPDGRLFVSQQDGQLRIVKNDALLPTPFLTITVDSQGERGLLGIAFDPAFVTNQFIYVYYTANTPGIHNRVSRFTASGDVAVPGSEVVLIELENSTASNHNGGAIHFGPDGELYVTVGDGGNGENAELLTNRFGKMLRIDADGAIPSDNPFFDTATGANRSIWAFGLRNPYTFAFQSGTGRMFVNDVGENSWEEINEGIPGSHYGWPTTEGPTSNPAFRAPLLAYNHSEAGVCAITGAAFYDDVVGTYAGDFDGDYFYADFCAGFIRRFDPMEDTGAGFATGVDQPVDLQSGPDGNLYYLSRGLGSVFRVTSCVGSSPDLSALSTSAPTSGLVLASGNGFELGTRLDFGVLPASAQPSGADLVVAVPALPLGPVSVRAVNPNGCRSNPIAFTVIPQPACGLLGIEPIFALAGAWLVSALRSSKRLDA